MCTSNVEQGNCCLWFAFASLSSSTTSDRLTSHYCHIHQTWCDFPSLILSFPIYSPSFLFPYFILSSFQKLLFWFSMLVARSNKFTFQCVLTNTTSCTKFRSIIYAFLIDCSASPTERWIENKTYLPLNFSSFSLILQWNIRKAFKRGGGPRSQKLDF